VSAPSPKLNYESYTLYPLLIEAIAPFPFKVGAVTLVKALASELETISGVEVPVPASFSQITTNPAVFCDYSAIERAVAASFRPLTGLRDEACFIRVLQICEASFFSARTLAESVDALKGDAVSICLEDIKTFLHIAISATRITMTAVTTAGFREFTALTGNISAIESENYALCEAHLCEINEERLSSLLFRMHPSVAAKIRNADTLIARASASIACPNVATALAEAQTELQNWKKMHLAAMVKVLGQDSVDKNVVKYLRRFINSNKSVANENITNSESKLETLC
jgi:hypothetical protein